MICNDYLINTRNTSLLVYTAQAPIILIFRSGIVWSFVSVVSCIPFRKFRALIRFVIVERVKSWSFQRIADSRDPTVVLSESLVLSVTCFCSVAFSD